MSLHTSCTKLNRFNSTNDRSVYKSRRLSKPEAMSTLISFDVDGTLIRSTGHNANKVTPSNTPHHTSPPIPLPTASPPSNHTHSSTRKPSQQHSNKYST